MLRGLTVLGMSPPLRVSEPLVFHKLTARGRSHSNERNYEALHFLRSLREPPLELVVVRCACTRVRTDTHILFGSC
jgi:hypothetical protein